MSCGKGAYGFGFANLPSSFQNNWLSFGTAFPTIKNGINFSLKVFYIFFHL